MMKKCERCACEFHVKPGHDARRRFCSKTCRCPAVKPEYTPPTSRPEFRRDLTGQTHNGVFMVGPSGRRDGKGQFKYLCKCHCGSEFEAIGTRVASGHTKSCGCLKHRPEHSITHGYTINRDIPVEYNTWSCMIDRCENHNNKRFDRYGGRGIYVCAGWRHSFDVFLEDMGRRPGSKMSIDRINNDGPYACGKCEQCLARGQIANCRWATHRQQMMNTSTNRMMEHNGVTMTMTEWGNSTGIAPGTLGERLRLGWSVADALTSPVRPRSLVRKKRVPMPIEERLARQAHGQRLAHVANGGHKLVADEVREIKRRLASGEKHNRLAREFGVSNTMIGYIASGKQWSQVEV
jgi:hypothetical protein